MEVLMLGWEFPPFNLGGLGTACFGLTKALNKKGLKIKFILPTLPHKVNYPFVELISADVPFLKDEILNNYPSYEIYFQEKGKEGEGKGKSFPLYSSNLFKEIDCYAKNVSEISKHIDFDVIHSHDWLTMKAALEVKKNTNKPLIVHVHATEFDRTGGNGVNPYVYSIEKEGMEKADCVVVVSNYTKEIVKTKYNIDEDKIFVVHNGIECGEKCKEIESAIKEHNKIVLFLGRITLQKGPDYFIKAAKKVSEYVKNVKFVITGSGDMEPYVIEESARLGIADKVIFTGFLRGKEVDYMYKLADVYVMPSVSEPFGISPLEAIKNDCPVIISKTSGVSEVLSHCLKVDFWDIDQLANQIMAVISYKPLSKEMVKNGSEEIKSINWDSAADKCIDIYNQMYNKG
jgi:glycosyltransferase involved in cell wall biosynthesis